MEGMDTQVCDSEVIKMTRQIEKVKVTCEKLREMADTIRRSVRAYNPESGQANGYVYTNGDID